MILAWLAPALVGLALAASARRIALYTSPRAATMLLTLAGLTVALASGLLLCVGAVVGVAETPLSAVIGRWSPTTVQADSGLPVMWGAASGLLAAILMTSATVSVARMYRQRRRVAGYVRSLPSSGGVSVVPAAPGGAFAFGGIHRRIVVAAPLLQRMSPAQRDALLAHERAHLRHRHDVYTRLARLSVAANPLLGRVAGAVDLAVERWADEVAVRETGDRGAVASALAVAALAPREPGVGSGAVLGAVGADVVERVQLTMQPRPGRTLVWAGVLVLAIGTCWSAAAVVVQHVHHLLELAELNRG
ncbi:MAG: hypothetical protein QOE97_738 [Pseudonocardiales bacterium]|nr:hypothetical protein [Pseudonocardiales bacterium]